MPLYDSTLPISTRTSGMLPAEQSVMNASVMMRFINPLVAGKQMVTHDVVNPETTITAKAKADKFRWGHAITTVNFQFPPKILSDAKHVNWQEIDQRSYEPLAIFMGSKARTIDMKIEYVVYGGEWTPQKIFNEVLKFKRHLYFGATGGIFGDKGPRGMKVTPNKAPYVQLMMYQIVPRSSKNKALSTWRVLSSNILYSEEMVAFNTDSQSIEAAPNSAWPVHTTIKLSLAMVTRQLMNNRPIAGGKQRLADMGSVIPDNPQDIWY